MKHLELLLAALVCCLLHPMVLQQPALPLKIGAALLLFLLLGLGERREEAEIPMAEWEPLTPIPIPGDETPEAPAVCFRPENPVSCAEAEATACGAWPPRAVAIQWSG